MGIDIHRFGSDPSIFQHAIHVSTGSGSHRLGDCMADFQADRFNGINPSLSAIANHQSPPIPRIWDERTKGGSKDTDWTINLLWLLAFSRRMLRIQVGAYDAQQAGEIRLIVKSILKIDSPVNRFLSQVIQVQTDKIINTKTDSICEILTTDKLGSHGSRPDVVLINELTHQTDSGFAETLLDNLDKMPNGFGIIATNSGFDPSWQKEWKKTFSESPRWKILELNHPSPWVSPEALKESERRNSPSRFARLWKGQWVSDTDGALDPTDIHACFTLTEPMTGKEKGQIFVASLDIGIRKHATGFVIVGKNVGYTEEKPKPKRKLTSTQKAMIEAGLWEESIEDDEPEVIFHEPTHRLRLAHCQVWKPKPGKRVSLESVKVAIIQAYKQFDFEYLVLDPHQGEHLIELLERENIPVLRVPQTSNSLQDQATSLIEAFQERIIDLYPDEDLKADLLALKLFDNGVRTRLVSPEKTTDKGSGTAHGDLVSALSFSIPVLKTCENYYSHSVVNRPIIAY